MAYAAVTSLKCTIDRLHMKYSESVHHRLSLCINKPVITESAYWGLLFIQSTLEGLDDRRHTNIDRSSINTLEAKISEAAYKFEDAIEFYALNHSCSRSDSLDQICPRVAECDWTSVKQESISFFTTLDELVKDYIRVLDNPLPQNEEEDDDDEDLGRNEREAVGLSDLVEEITKELLDSHPGPKSASLVGMAGIGKTRLAREICRRLIINQHFKCVVWVRIGQHPDTERVRRYVVARVEKQQPINSNLVANHIVPTPRINQGERYLLVLDDVWCKKVIECLEDGLPGHIRRRILVTTRLQRVARYHSTSIHRMPFLDKEQSWSLLRQIVFADNESISSQLEEAGRIIAENCEGLPLLILTVANILRGNDINEEYWKKVADKKTTTFPYAYDQIYEVLISSYYYLPQNLKACFLYMGVFPQTFEIPLPKLLPLWSIEEFMDETTYLNQLECIPELVSNNIVIICKQSSEFTIKSCKLHSVYWYLCVKEARKVKFFHALNKLTDVSIESRPRRLSFQNNVLFGIKDVYDSMAANTSSTTRSLLCTGAYHQYPVRICFNMILLKVLDASAIRFYEFPSEILNLIQLRYLALTHDGMVHSSISNLQKMQYLILRQHHNIKFLRHSRYLPEEIWDMYTLLNLQIVGCNLPDPPNKRVMLHNLITLHVNVASCTEKVFKSIYSLRKLRITIELEPDADRKLRCFEHIGLLRSLNSLKCVVVNTQPMTQVDASPHHLSNFSECLRKLSFNGLGYSWKNIKAIGLLPRLEVLKLRCNAFHGPEWESRPEEFKSLEVLVLEDIDLVNWTFERDSTGMFRYLRRLILKHCYKLKQIPNIRNLETLEVVDCSPALVASVEQRPSDNLQVAITSSWKFH